MEYCPESEFRELILRSRKLQRKKEQEKLKIPSALSVSLAVTLVLCIHCFSGYEFLKDVPLQYGSFLLPAEAGGYILTAVAAFAAGACLTAVIMLKRQRKKGEGFSRAHKAEWRKK